jgi:hypothetical protein
MKIQQAPAALLMVRPASFAFNVETAETNRFQQPDEARNADAITKTAQIEFDYFGSLLSAHNIQTFIYEDDLVSASPDAVFPNNWISFQPGGQLIIYPMMAPVRRRERRDDIVKDISKHFIVNEVMNLAHYENEGEFLEGTGSLVFDHASKIIFANRSPRTSEKLVKILASRLHYKPIIFDADDEHGKPIYHTNVMMSIANKFAVVCLDAIKDEVHQDFVLDALAEGERQVIAISYQQMNAFAGNLLEVQNKEGEPYVLISEAAIRTLLPGQLDSITKFADVLPIDIPTIEKYGGGSVRCMVAGIHLQKRNDAA